MNIPSSFFSRFCTTIFMLFAVLIESFLCVRWLLFLIIGILVFSALWEYFSMLKNVAIRYYRLFAVCATSVLFAINFFLLPYKSLYPIPNFRNSNSIFCIELLFFFLFFIFLFVWSFREKKTDQIIIERIIFTLFGVFYIPWLFLFLPKIFYILPLDSKGQSHGKDLLLFVILVTKSTDIGAFISGSFFGKKPFFQHISPKKTWEGIIGGIILGIIVGVIFENLFPKNLPSHTIIISFFITIFAILGDLSESLLKRSLDAKDSGYLLPGIGGSLDLIDSLLFTLPLFYFFLRFSL